MLNLDKNLKYLLACSFGPDSMALFSILLNNGYNFEVAHVNYHYREESDFEENQLRQYCEDNNIKLHVYNNQNKVTGNLEKEAREIRYNYFLELVHEYNYDALLVAHNEDDHIETYLMQKKAGNYVKYFGINCIFYYHDMKIIRPLLTYKKVDLLSYCDNNNIPYSIDKSNFDTSYLRNKIRIEIVSNYSEEERLTILKEIDSENERLSALISSIDFSKSNEIDYLKTLDEYQFVYVMHYLINDIGVYHLSKKNIQEIHKIINSSRPNVSLRYKDYFLVKEYNNLYFKKEDIETDFSYLLTHPAKLDTPYFYLDFTNDSSNRNVSIDDYPLIIRDAKKDDMIKINDYEVSVRRLFIDWKMPMSLRTRWPIIINKDGVAIYIPRYQKDFVKSDNLNFYVKY